MTIEKYAFSCLPVGLHRKTLVSVFKNAAPFNFALATSAIKPKLAPLSPHNSGVGRTTKRQHGTFQILLTSLSS